MHVVCIMWEWWPLKIFPLLKKEQIMIIVFYKNSLGHIVHCNGHNILYEICTFF
jgi:hypothetical protein